MAMCYLGHLDPCMITHHYNTTPPRVSCVPLTFPKQWGTACDGLTTATATTIMLSVVYRCFKFGTNNYIF